jgi:hypothetical protein
LEDLFNFGLDALFVVSDATPPDPAVAAPACRAVGLKPSVSGIVFSWTSPGRVFQLETALSIEGPWQPVGPILTTPPSQDAGALTNSPRSYYRLWQW